MRNESKHKFRKLKRDKFQFELLEPRQLFSVSDGSPPPIEHMGFADDISFGHHVESYEDAGPGFGAQANEALTSFLYLPMVTAGPNASVNAFATLQLNAEVIVNVQDNLSIQWSKLSGPGTATFSNASATNSTVQFDQAGTYVLQLAATNRGVTALSQLTVNVAAANVVNIDAAWLANAANQVTANGHTAYVLKQAGKTYVLQTDVSTSGSAFYIANQNIMFDLNGHTVTYNTANLTGPTVSTSHRDGFHGIVIYYSGHNGEASISDAGLPWNSVIKNGKVVNAHAGALAHGIYARRAYNVTIEGMEVTTDGKDSHTILIEWANDQWATGFATVRDCILTTNTTSTFDRHMLPCNVRVNGKLTAERNILLGGNGGFNVADNSYISKNVIAQSGFATNGYAVGAGTGTIVENNIVLPMVSGRGLFLNSNGTIRDNIILHLEKPNAEFGTGLNPPATRARYGGGGGVYSGNTSLGIAGGDYTGATSIYLSTYGNGSHTFTNNDATTILIGAPDATHYAHPVSLEGTGAGASATGPGIDVIAGNNFKSNDRMVTLVGFDGGGRQKTPLSGNTWEWETGGDAYTNFMSAVNTKLAAIDFTTAVEAAVNDYVAAVDERIEGLIAEQGLQADRAFWRTDGWSAQDVYADIVDSTFGTGVDPKTFGSNTAHSRGFTMRDGFTKRIQFLNTGNPVANTQVTITPPQGTAYTTTTDANGFADVVFYRFAITTPGSVSANFTVTDFTQSTLTIGGSSRVINHASVPNQIDVGAGVQSQGIDDQQSSTRERLMSFLANRSTKMQSTTAELRSTAAATSDSAVAEQTAVQIGVFQGPVTGPSSRAGTAPVLISETRAEELRELEVAFDDWMDRRLTAMLDVHPNVPQ